MITCERLKGAYSEGEVLAIYNEVKKEVYMQILS